MKLTPAQVTALKSKNFSGVTSLLFYGAAEYFIKEGMGALGERTNLRHVYEDDILKTGAGLTELLTEPDLFSGGPSVVCVCHATDKLASPIKEALNILPVGHLSFVVQSLDYLSPSSKLRTLYEGSPHLGSVACHVPSALEMGRNFQSFYRRHNKVLDEATSLSLACAALQRTSEIEGLLEKLLLFTESKKEITEEDLRACTELTLSDDLTEVCFSFFDQHSPLLCELLEYHSDHSTSSITVLRQLANYTVRLLELKALIEQGHVPEKAFSLYKPPVFWAHKPKVLSHLTKYPISALRTVLERLVHLEGDIKENSTSATDILVQGLMAACLGLSSSLSQKEFSS